MISILINFDWFRFLFSGWKLLNIVHWNFEDDSAKKYYFWNWFNRSHCTKSVWVLSSHIAKIKVKPSEDGFSNFKSTDRILVLFRAKTVFRFFIDQIKWWSKCSLMFSRRLSQNSFSLPFYLYLFISFYLFFPLKTQSQCVPLKLISFSLSLHVSE